jgi:hypothetical protein
MQQPQRPNWPILNSGSNHAKGLYGWWVPTHGGWVDLAHGHRYPGTLTNGASIGQADARVGGLCGTFDGTDDNVLGSTSTDLDVPSGICFMVSIWCRLDTVNSTWRGLVTKSREAAGFWGIWITNTNKYHFRCGGGNFNSTTTVTTGLHHIILRNNTPTGAGNLTGFIDGVKDATTGSAATMSDGTYAMRIGCAYDGAVYEALHGQIYDVRVYRAVSTNFSDAFCYSLYDPQTRWDLYQQPMRPRFVVPTAAGGGRTALNTRSWPLGVEIGMGWRMPA